jgi:sec-independent protein translocase protein TatA
MAPSPLQLIIVCAIIVVLFGASRFADLGKGLGEGIRNFKKGISDDEREKIAEADSDDKKDAKES